MSLNQSISEEAKMARPRKSMAVQEAERHVHVSKADRERRKAAEDFGGDESIVCPDRIEDKESRLLFITTAESLKGMGIWKSIDSDQLARYVQAEMLYRMTTEKYMAAIGCGDEDEASTYERRQDKAFRQAQAAANALGLNVTSRCRIAVPNEERPKRLEL